MLAAGLVGVGGGALAVRAGSDAAGEVVGGGAGGNDGSSAVALGIRGPPADRVVTEGDRPLVLSPTLVVVVVVSPVAGS